MCWLVLHCRPGLACHGETKEKAEQKTAEGHQRMLPATFSSPINSAFALPTTPVTSITRAVESTYTCSPASASPRPKTKRLDRRPDWRSAWIALLHNPAQPERDKGVYAVHGRPTTNIHKANLPTCHLPSLLRLPARILCSMQVHLENHTAQLAKTLLAFTGIYLHRAYTRPGGHY
jgi:hypothetical protein